MNKPLVSVVIPAFNEEKYIAHTLAAISLQSYPNFEIIVVDNNSTDATATIASNFGAKVIKEKRQGYVYALNKGMSTAKGEIIAVTDADSEPSPFWLETIVRGLKEPNVVAVTGSMNTNTHSSFLNWTLYWSFCAFVVLNFVVRKPHISGANFAVRTEAFLKVGGLNELYTMSPDVDLGLRLSKIGRVLFIREMNVTVALRRWNTNIVKVFGEYARAYLFTVWLRKPASVKQVVVR